MGVLDHWHFDTFRINTEKFESYQFRDILDGSFVTFDLNAQAKVAEMHIEDLAVFKRVD